MDTPGFLDLAYAQFPDLSDAERHFLKSVRDFGVGFAELQMEESSVFKRTQPDPQGFFYRHVGRRLVFMAEYLL